jgi:hypothetical protein
LRIFAIWASFEVPFYIKIREFTRGGGLGVRIVGEDVQARMLGARRRVPAP